MPKKTTHPKIPSKNPVRIQDLTVPELIQKSVQIKNEIQKTQLEKSVGRVKNLRHIFNLRKTLARTLSTLTEKSVVKSK